MFLQVNHIKKGINPSSVDEIYFTGEYVSHGFRIGVVAGMVALTVSNFNRSTLIKIMVNHNQFFTLLKLRFSNPRKP